MNIRLFLPVAVTLLAASASTQAALLAYDPFNQAPGPMNDTRSSGAGVVWPGVTNNWFSGSANTVISTGSLSYGPLLTGGNQANLDNSGSSIFRAFDTTFGGDGSDLWISFLIVGTADNTGISLFQVGAENNFMGAGGGSGQTIGLQNPNINTGVAVGPATHFYAIRLNMTPAGVGTHTIYVDPAFSSLGNGAAPTGGVTGSGTQADFTWDRIRLGDFNGSNTATRFDEFRMGNTWADVSPVPEPSTFGLLALMTVGMAARRRRA